VPLFDGAGDNSAELFPPSGPKKTRCPISFFFPVSVPAARRLGAKTPPNAQAKADKFKTPVMFRRAGRLQSATACQKLLGGGPSRSSAAAHRREAGKYKRRNIHLPGGSRQGQASRYAREGPPMPIGGKGPVNGRR